MANAFRSAKTIGWDSDLGLIEAASLKKKCRANFQRKQFFSNVNPVEQFSGVIFRQVLMDVPDPVALLKWSKRLIEKKGGIIAALEPDYGATVIEPEPRYWREFFLLYSDWAKKNGEDFLSGRKSMAYFLKSEISKVSFHSIISTHFCSDGITFKKFIENEIFSIESDMDRFISDTGYSKRKVRSVFLDLRALAKISGSYIQTQMNCIVGEVLRRAE
jgi:hypothetical protein